MESRVYPELDDIVSSLQLRRWFEAPQRSVTTQTYGAQLLWRFLDRRQPRLLPAYLARSARAPGDTRAATLVSTYERVARRPFAAEFGRFAVWTADRYGDRLVPVRRLARGKLAGGSVAPLAIHFLRVPHAARSVTVSGDSSAELVDESHSPYAGRASITRRLPSRKMNGSRTFTIPSWLRGSARLARATLVVANGHASPMRYSVAVG